MWQEKKRKRKALSVIAFGSFDSALLAVRFVAHGCAQLLNVRREEYQVGGEIKKRRRGAQQSWNRYYYVTHSFFSVCILLYTILGLSAVCVRSGFIWILNIYCVIRISFLLYLFISREMFSQFSNGNWKNVSLPSYLLYRSLLFKNKREREEANSTRFFAFDSFWLLIFSRRYYSRRI